MSFGLGTQAGQKRTPELNKDQNFAMSVQVSPEYATWQLRTFVVYHALCTKHLCRFVAFMIEFVRLVNSWFFDASSGKRNSKPDCELPKARAKQIDGSE